MLSPDKLDEFKFKFKLKNNINLQLSSHGIDTYAECRDKKHFSSFPYKVDYTYNSLGYRDEELPTKLNDLKNAIWCIGDSFTVGLGSPLEHTWYKVLQKETKIRCINISMDGASNEWISMLAVYIIKNFNPINIVCCWSYPERRIDNIQKRQNELIANAYTNIKDFMWPNCKSISDFNKLPINIRKEVLSYDLELNMEVNENLEIDKINITYDALRVYVTKDTHIKDLDNMIGCITETEKHKTNTLIHSFIPKFCNCLYKQDYKNKIEKIVKKPIYIKYLDYARDGHHFDILTSKELVKNIIKQLDLDKQ